MTTLVIRADGRVDGIYTEAVDLAAFGVLHIRRASHVEPDDRGQWWADLSPVSGPLLGPFAHRSEALTAEGGWLSQRLNTAFAEPLGGYSG